MAPSPSDWPQVMAPAVLANAINNATTAMNTDLLLTPCSLLDVECAGEHNKGELVVS